MIRLISFDLDDTLWDMRATLQRAENAQWDWLERHYPGKISRSNRESHTALRQRLLTDDPNLIHHISELRRRFLETLLLECDVSEREASTSATEAFEVFLEARHDVDIYPETIPVLSQLSAHFTLASLTNGNADVRKTPLGRFFPIALKAEDVGASKPAPALFAAAVKQAGVTASAMVHVGDHLDHDIEGARAFGARAVWLSPEGEVSQRADASVRSLADLPAVLKTLL